MDHPILCGICPMPALRADVPAHLSVASDLHTCAPLSISGEQVQGIRKHGEIILFTVQMPRPNQFDALLHRRFRLFRLVPAGGGAAALRFLLSSFCVVCFRMGFLRTLFGFRCFAAGCQAQAEDCRQQQRGCSFHRFILLLHDSVSGVHQSAYEVPKQAFRFGNPVSILDRLECQNSIIHIDPYCLFLCFHSPKFLSKPARKKLPTAREFRLKCNCIKSFSACKALPVVR